MIKPQPMPKDKTNDQCDQIGRFFKIAPNQQQHRNTCCMIVCDEAILWIEECARQGHNSPSLICTQSLKDIPWTEPQISYCTMYHGYDASVHLAI